MGDGLKDLSNAPAVQDSHFGPSRGIDLLTGPEGDIMGFQISPAAQLFNMIDRLVASPRVVALPIGEKYALAGKVAAVPAEQKRLVEQLASTVATARTEAGALNALYIIETCKELVPGFKDAIPENRLSEAAEITTHSRVQAAVLLGNEPEEWKKAAQQDPQATVILFPREEEEEDKGLVYEAGRAVGDATKFVGGAALGGVGLVTDTLGITDKAEETLANTAEDTVDLVGDGVNAVVDGIDEAIDGIDQGLDGTSIDIEQKGVAGAVGDGVADAVDIVTDFVVDGVQGIAGSVHSVLNWAAGDTADEHPGTAFETHKVLVVVAELFGDEKSLGLRIENRVVTKFTKTEAEGLGWHLGDCIVGVGAELVATQEELLAAIAANKGALKKHGTPIQFLVERLGAKPKAPKAGDVVRVQGRAATVQGSDARRGTMVVKFHDDGSMVRLAAREG